MFRPNREWFLQFNPPDHFIYLEGGVATDAILGFFNSCLSRVEPILLANDLRIEARNEYTLSVAISGSSAGVKALRYFVNREKLGTVVPNYKLGISELHYKSGIYGFLRLWKRES